MIRNCQRRWFDAEFRVHFCGRTFDGLSADDGGDGNHRSEHLPLSLNMGKSTARIGSMLTHGLDGQMMTASADWIASCVPGVGFAEFDSGKPKASHARLTGPWTKYS